MSLAINMRIVTTASRGFCKGFTAILYWERLLTASGLYPFMITLRDQRFLPASSDRCFQLFLDVGVKYYILHARRKKDQREFLNAPRNCLRKTVASHLNNDVMKKSKSLFVCFPSKLSFEIAACVNLRCS